MAQASRASKAIVYKRKGTHPMIARMVGSHRGKKAGMHIMPGGKMMSDKEMAKMKK